MVSGIIFIDRAAAPTLLDALPLHDALPICQRLRPDLGGRPRGRGRAVTAAGHRGGRGEVLVQVVDPLDPAAFGRAGQIEEHTSELQSPVPLVCRLLLVKKKRHSTAYIDYHL